MGKLNKFFKKDYAADGLEVDILTLEQLDDPRITYDRMQGRPSIEVAIQEQNFDCLLDTGARVNVMSLRVFNTLSDVRLKETSIKLRCANNSILEAKGEIDLDTRIGKRIELVQYTIVSESWPDIIGGIEMQKQFGFCLKC